MWNHWKSSSRKAQDRSEHHRDGTLTHKDLSFWYSVKNLEKVAAVFKNQSAIWTSPALTVRKPGTDALRFTVYVRGVNLRTDPIEATTAHNDCMIQECQGGDAYAAINFCHGYWQIPLHKESREIMSIQTLFGVFSPHMLIQGRTDSGYTFKILPATHLTEKSKRCCSGSTTV